MSYEYSGKYRQYFYKQTILTKSMIKTDKTKEEDCYPKD